MRRVLVTRPLDDAAPLVQALAERGVEALVEPLLAIRTLEGEVPSLDGAQALLFTSANGVRTFAQRSPERAIRVLAVGDATGEAAHAAGFTHIDSAAGDVEDLAEMAERLLSPTAGRLVHVAGSQVAGDLGGLLERAAFTVERLVLYEAVPSIMLSASATEAISRGTIDSVLLFSPRTAETFASLVRKADLEVRLKPVAAVCLSHAVADRLPTDRFRAMVVANRPDLTSMLDAVDRAAAPEEAVALPTPDKSDAPTPPAPAPARAGFGLGALALTGLLSVAATLALLAGTVNIWRPLFLPASPQAPDPRPAMAELQRRVAAVEAAQAAGDMALRGLGSRIGPLEEVLRRPAPPPAPSVPADLVVRLERLEAATRQPQATAAPSVPPIDLAPLTERLARLENRAPPGPDMALVAKVDDLDRRVTATEGQVASANARTSRSAALALATAQLIDSARGERPFLAQVDAVARLADPSVDLAGLRRAGARGVPTTATLAARFAPVARRMTTAAAIAESGRVLGELRAAVGRAVAIRRLDDGADSDPVDGALARAERALGEGRLEAALEALTALPAEVRDAGAAWLAEAEARRALDADLARLRASVLAERG